MLFLRVLQRQVEVLIDVKMDIDLVYLWCDGNDPDWLEKKNAALKVLGKPPVKNAVNDCRFVQSDELMYSLRSVEKYAPWIRKIFIVTAGQTPVWLNLDHPKIKMVDHKDIMPAEALPTFSSTSIESCLPYIEGLSEYFLFANDDMMFWNNVTPQDFFTSDGKPICRMRQKIHNKNYKHLYGYMVSKAYRMVKEKFGLNMPYFPHHNIDVYRKTYFIDCINDFKQDFDRTTLMQFREFDAVQRSIVTYYMFARGIGQAKLIEKPKWNPFFKEESIYAKCLIKKLKGLDKKDCKFVCVNDSEKTQDIDRVYMQDILRQKFPEKSSFELAAS